MNVMVSLPHPEKSTSPQEKMKPLEVVINPPDMTFGYVFDLEVSQRLQNFQRRLSLFDDVDAVHNPLLGDAAWEASPRVHTPKHKLNHSTLDFLKDKSELVATVTSLVAEVSTDSIANELMEEHYPVKTPEEEKQHEDLTKFEKAKRDKDMGYFKYQKLLRDYPALQRCMMLDREPLISACVQDFGSSDDLLWEMCHLSCASEYRASLLLPTTGPHYQHLLLSVIAQLIDRLKWGAAIDLLNKVPCRSFRDRQKWADTRDYVLCCAINASPFILSTTEVLYVPSMVAQIEDLSLRRRVVLSNLQHWEVKDAIALLRLCCRFGDQNTADELTKAVHIRLHQMKVYEQVCLV